MKPIARALADAARQLEDASDTARLDSELLMAEALHIDRDRLILAPPDYEARRADVATGRLRYRNGARRSFRWGSCSPRRP